MTIKITPKTWYEVEGEVVHCEASDGIDYTLCGFSLDGDQGEIIPGMVDKITCKSCIGIIKFCQSISTRSVSSKQGNTP